MFRLIESEVVFWKTRRSSKFSINFRHSINAKAPLQISKQIIVQFVDLEKWTVASNLVSEDATVSSRSLLEISSSLHQNRPRPWFNPILKEKAVRARVLAKWLIHYDDWSISYEGHWDLQTQRKRSWWGLSSVKFSAVTERRVYLLLDNAVYS